MGRALTTVLSFVLLVALAASCSSSTPAPSRILLVGVDGLEWDVMGPMLRAGELPNLARLMSRGAYGRLRTIDPTVSPVVWTSIATAKPRELHGIGGFAWRDSANRRHLFRSTDRRCKAFWNILTEAGRTCHVVGWWITYPAEKIRGTMVSQYATSEQVFDVWKGTIVPGVAGQTYPPELMEELEPILAEVGRESDATASEVFGDLDPNVLDGGERVLASMLLEQSRWSLRADEIYARVAEHLLRTRDDWDLFAVYFGLPDVIGHRFWRYYRPSEFAYRPSRRAQSSFEDLIPRCYRRFDEILGSLLALVGDDVTVIVISDHGMHSFQTDKNFARVADLEVENLNSGHHFPAATAPGVLLAAGPPIVAGPGFRAAEFDASRLPIVGSVARILPTLLELLGVPGGRDMRADPIGEILTPEFRERHPMTWIPTHETPGWRPPTVDTGEASGEENIEERLRNLGYLDANAPWENRTYGGEGE